MRFPTKELPIKSHTAGIMLAATVLLVLLLPAIFRTLQNPPRMNPCAGAKARYECYISRFHELMRRDGMEEAVGFVLTAAREDEDPAFAHNLLHPIGQEVYRSVRNLDQARAYLSRYYERYRQDLPPGTLLTDVMLEGYHHGVLQAYLTEHEAVPRPELMRTACRDTIDLERPDDPVVRKSSGRCFHALGHALMYANKNHLWRSLADCDRLPQVWTRGYCYYGAFMEHHYRSTVLALHVAPRPEEPEPPAGPLGPICERSSEPYRPACHRLVGRDELVRNGGDFGAAFGRCRELDPSDRGPCITETAFGLIALGNDFKAIAAVCRERAGAEYERACIIGAAVGVNSKPERGDLARFCAAVPDEFRSDCATADASYAALDFTH